MCAIYIEHDRNERNDDQKTQQQQQPQQRRRRRRRQQQRQHTFLKFTANHQTRCVYFEGKLSSLSFLFASELRWRGGKPTTYRDSRMRLNDNTQYEIFSARLARHKEQMRTTMKL